MTRLFALGTLLASVLLMTLVISPTNTWAQDDPAPETEAATPEATEAEEEAELVVLPGDKFLGAGDDDAFAEISDDVQSWSVLGSFILFVCAVLVLFMQAGFGMVEVGFNSSKNTVNILFKNVMDLCLGAILFWAIGYNILYSSGDSGLFNMPSGVGISETSGVDSLKSDGDGYPGNHLVPQVDFLFQVAFAATAATIVSGAVAGRMKFAGYLVYSAVLTALVYPISGFWQWGQGFLYQDGFHDFAGSLIVHAVGGFAGLAGAIVLGPRIGRYSAEGKSQPMPGHNLTFAALGVFILLIGWFGFNPGSQLTFSGVTNINTTMLCAVNTLLAAAAGGVLATIVSWIIFSKPDLSMALNGMLAGLVGITANCDCVTNVESLAIGAVAGVLVVLGVIMLDKLKIDDPVGAWPVHGLCGIWGGIATGIFGEGKDLVVQLKGTLCYCVWAFVTMFILFMILKAVGLLRVSEEEEIRGLDLSEHGMHAYETTN